MYTKKKQIKKNKKNYLNSLIRFLPILIQLLLSKSQLHKMIFNQHTPAIMGLLHINYVFNLQNLNLYLEI